MYLGRRLDLCRENKGTGQLVARCASVSPYAKSWFSYDAVLLFLLSQDAQTVLTGRCVW